MIFHVFGKFGTAVLAVVAMFFGTALATGAPGVGEDDHRAWRHAERASYSQFGDSGADAYLAWRIAERESYRRVDAVPIGTYLAWRQGERVGYRPALQSAYLDWRRSERASISSMAPRLAEPGVD